jgi:heme/copper-type cytochrome/quinol oxidase subunit 3
MTTFVVPVRRTRPAAWWGMLILIAAEATLFGCLLGTYFYLRFHSARWPQGGLPKPHVVIPLVLALVLASTSAPMQLASNAAHAGRLAAARLFLVAALVVQTGYFAYEVHDFSSQLHRFDITVNAYSSIYYTLLGADHAHVFFGLLFDVWLIGKLARGLTRYRLNALQGITWYWHAVNLLTLAVIGTLLSAAA